MIADQKFVRTYCGDKNETIFTLVAKKERVYFCIDYRYRNFHFSDFNLHEIHCKQICFSGTEFKRLI